MRRGRGLGRGMGSAELVWIGTQLTDDQKAAVQDKIDAMRAEDATREDIHAAVGQMLAGYSIDLPEDGSWRLGFRGNGSQVWIATELTEEQQTALQEKIEGMREEGAGWEDIRAATAEVLAGFGIAIPEGASWRTGHDWSGGLGRLGGLLTDEQQTALQAKVDELKEAGATRAEIRAAIDAQMEDLGIEIPTRGFGRMASLLTEEQHAVLQATIDKLREEGAGRDEIHAAVQEELEAMGIEAPAMGGRGGRHGRGGWRGRMGRK